MKTSALVLALFALPVFGANHVIEQKTFDIIAAEYSGERAQETDRKIVESHRIQGSPMMLKVASEVILAPLKTMGVTSDAELFPSDGKTSYQTYLSPMAWSIRSGELWTEGDNPIQLCRYSDVPMCVSTYSRGGDWSGELVDVGPGTSDADYAGKDLKGKVALASGYAANVVRNAVLKHGAVGAVIYPASDDRPEHPDMIRYNGVWTRADEVASTSGSFQISLNQYNRLRTAMAKGPVRVHGRIDATLDKGNLTLIHAWLRGTDSPADELIVTAHLDHPKWSANDNASGSSAMLEMVRTLSTLIDSGKLPRPHKTIHFIWVPEYFGTIAYLTKHSEIHACGTSPCVMANINMDMVGEDTVKTNGRFYMTRSTLAVPSFLDALLPDALEQTKEAGLFATTGTRNYWPAEMSGYMPGSDHDVFLAIGAPATMFGHDPDWTHHTSEDTPDKTDASELRRVGVLASVTAYWVAAADDGEWQRLAPWVVAEKLRADAGRLAQLRLLDDAAGAGRGRESIDAMRTRLAQTVSAHITSLAALASRPKLDTFGNLLGDSEKQVVSKNDRWKRNTIGPIDAHVWESLSEADRKTMETMRKGDGNFDTHLFELVNLSNGARSPSDVADLLTIEFGTAFSGAWVDDVSRVLASLKLMTRETAH